MDGLLVNIVGVCVGVGTVVSGTIGILVKQAKNNGRIHEQIAGLREQFRSTQEDVSSIKEEFSEMNGRVSTMEGYLKGMDDFRKRNGG